MSKIVLWFLVYWFAGLVKCQTDLFNNHQPSSIISILSDLIEEAQNIALGQSNVDDESEAESVKNNIRMKILNITRELPETNKTNKKKTGQAMIGVAIASGVIGVVSFSLFTLVALAVVSGKALLVGTVALVMSLFSGVNSYQNKVKKC